MKNLLFLLINIYGINIYCQVQKTETACADCPVGINTTTVQPGVIVEVDNKSDNLGGVLLPEVQLKSLHDTTPFKTPPADGVIVYNPAVTTDPDPTLNLTSGYYFWDASTSSWTSLESVNMNGNSDVFIASNVDTTTNYNENNYTPLQIFGEVKVNQNTENMYEVKDFSTLRINNKGGKAAIYQIVLKLNFKTEPSRNSNVFAINFYLLNQMDQIVIKSKDSAGGTNEMGTETVLYISVPPGGASLAFEAAKFQGEVNNGGFYFSGKGSSTISIQRMNIE